MTNYLATVPVHFTDEPSKDYLSDLNEALTKYDPRGAEGELFWVRDGSGTIVIRIVVEAIDESAAQGKARETVNSALVDTGHTVATAKAHLDGIETHTWES